MATTSHLALTLLEQSQAQKEITVNTALMRIDAVLNTGVIDKDLSSPPASPLGGDVYIVGSSPTGDWTGKAGQIAYFDQIWRFIIPNQGMTIWVVDEHLLYVYHGSEWIKVGGGAKRSLYIPASQMRASNSGGCAALAVTATGANLPDVQSLDFDATTEESAQFSLRMPRSWDRGSCAVAFEWSHAAASGTFGVVWGVQGVALSDGDGIGAAFGSAQEVTDTGGSPDTLYKTAQSAALSVSGSPQLEDTLCFRIYRKAASGSDTLTIDARLHGVMISYNATSASEE